MSKFIYELIDSLSTTEKVHFRRYASTHSDSQEKNYIKLYNVIEKNKVGAAELSTYFSGTKIGKHLNSEIAYLKEKILLSLFSHNINKTKKHQIQKGILLTEALAAKGFRKEALKKLRPIKKHAIKKEEFTVLLQLIELEETILFKNGIIGYKDELKYLRHQRELVTSQIQNLNDYRILREEIRESQYHLPLDSKKLATFNSNKLFYDKINCLSIRAEEHWHYVQVLHSYMTRDFKTGLQQAKAYVLYILKHNHLFGSTQMLPPISNFIYHAALTEDRNSFNEGVSYLSKFENDTSVSKPYYDYIYYSRQAEFGYYAKDIQIANDCLVPIRRVLTQESSKIENAQVQYLYMLATRVCIQLKNYKLGTVLVNQWQQLGVIPFRKVQARLFSMIIHFELGYLDLLKSENIALKRITEELDRDKDLSVCMGLFFKTIVWKPEEKAQAKQLLCKQLKVIDNSNPNYFKFIAFDYLQWAEQIEFKI